MAPRSIRSFPGEVQSAGLSVDVVRGRLEPRRGVHSGSVKKCHRDGKGSKEVELTSLRTIGDLQSASVPGLWWYGIRRQRRRYILDFIW